MLSFVVFISTNPIKVFTASRVIHILRLHLYSSRSVSKTRAPGEAEEKSLTHGDAQPTHNVYTIHSITLTSMWLLKTLSKDPHVGDCDMRENFSFKSFQSCSTRDKNGCISSEALAATVVTMLVIIGFVPEWKASAAGI